MLANIAVHGPQQESCVLSMAVFLLPTFFTCDFFSAVFPAFHFATSDSGVCLSLSQSQICKLERLISSSYEIFVKTTSSCYYVLPITHNNDFL